MLKRVPLRRTSPKRISLKRTTLTGILAGISFFCLQEIAFASIRQVSLETARASSVSVTVQEASGLSIDFSKSGERIYKVWLDDPSKLTVDFDGPLESGAQVIHLRRITGLSFENLPSGNSTLLTVVTRSGGTSNVYYFDIGYGATDTTGIAILPASSIALTDSLAPADAEPVELEMVRLGLQDAIANNVISSTSPVIERVNQFLTASTTGTAQRIAANEAELPWEVITRLAVRGRNASVLNALTEV
ncbi:MAG: hypothetical protein AAFZ17_00465 [Cyanobacteria bacterium J06650_10]